MATLNSFKTINLGFVAHNYSQPSSEVLRSKRDPKSWMQPLLEFQDYSTRATPTLPEELWYEVIKQASTIPSVAEFGIRPDQYMNIYTGGPTAIIDSEQLQVALRCRLKMVFVCRSWAALALPVLWSHLRIPLSNLGGILETLRSKPQLGLCVQRISVTEQHLHRLMLLGNFDDHDLLKALLNLCPNIISVQTPIFSGHAFPHTLKHLHILWRHPGNFFPLLPHSLTSLSIDVSRQPRQIVSFPPLQLPALRALDIRQLALYVHWARCIVEHWDFPCLQVLVMSGGAVDGVATLLRKFSHTLTTVKMYGHLMLAGWSGKPFHLEKLSRLDIISENSTIECLNAIVHFPNLRTLVVFWPYPREIPIVEIERITLVDMFCQFVRTAHTLCPTPAVFSLESQEYVEWLVKQRAAIEVLTEIMQEGRVLLPESCLPPLDLS